VASSEKAAAAAKSCSFLLFIERIPWFLCGWKQLRSYAIFAHHAQLRLPPPVGLLGMMIALPLRGMLVATGRKLEGRVAAMLQSTAAGIAI
jgi:hypothetical protein